MTTRCRQEVGAGSLARETLFVTTVQCVPKAMLVLWYKGGRVLGRRESALTSDCFRCLFLPS